MRISKPNLIQALLFITTSNVNWHGLPEESCNHSVMITDNFRAQLRWTSPCWVLALWKSQYVDPESAFVSRNHHKKYFLCSLKPLLRPCVTPKHRAEKVWWKLDVLGEFASVPGMIRYCRDFLMLTSGVVSSEVCAPMRKKCQGLPCFCVRKQGANRPVKAFTQPIGVLK